MINNYLENQVSKLIEYINKTEKGFGYKLHPNRNHKGVYISGEPFDYCIHTANKVYCFDAKQTINNKWILLKKDKQQAITLKKLKSLGIETFFLIYFITENKLMKINIEDLFLKVLPHRKYVKITDCEIWDYKEVIK